MNEVESGEVAAALLESVGLLKRRLQQAQLPGELTMPERSALSRLDRGGPTTSSALAKIEQISPQSMGATLAGLQARGLVERTPDEADGRRVVVSISSAGRVVLRDRRSARVDQLRAALVSDFTPAEIAQLGAAAPLIQRLADSF